MSLRRLIVEVDTTCLNVSRFCAEHGISTWFFYDLRRRFATGGWAAIEPRSRAAHRVANRTPAAVEDEIVAVRKELTQAGLDNGPGTIAYHLGTRGTSLPSEATIWRVLHRRGFIEADPAKAPKRAVRRFTAARANECWQSDDTHWELADGTPVKIINVIDDCSRVAPASRASLHATAEAIFDALTHGAAEWGWPERILWDHAKAHHALGQPLAALSIGTGHPRPYHPQTCGKVERFHQTVKRYLAAHDRVATLAELQAQLDAFRAIYNHQRPHRSLGRRIPAHIWAATPKSGPADRPLHASTQIHRVRVGHNGVAPTGRDYRIVLGRRYAGCHTTITITGRACHAFINGQLVRTLTLDPTRRLQPLNQP